MHYLVMKLFKIESFSVTILYKQSRKFDWNIGTINTYIIYVRDLSKIQSHGKGIILGTDIII